MLLIIWGRRTLQKRLGIVADFCAICRTFQPFRLVRHRSYPHLYYIPLGRFRHEGDFASCCDCGTSMETEVEFYDAIEPAIGDQGIEHLIRVTHPEIEENYADRLELEQRVERGMLQDEERRRLLVEPFMLLNRELEPFISESQVDRRSVKGCLTFLVPAIVIALIAMFGNVGEWSMPMGLTAFALTILAVITIFIMTARQARRYTDTVTTKNLVRALQPLRPHRNELNQIVEELRAADAAIGKMLRVDRLVKEFESVDPFTRY